MPHGARTFRPPTSKGAREHKTRSTKDRTLYNTAWWKAKRLEIAARDNWACQDCGCDVGLRAGDFHCDHIEERPQGACIELEKWDANENLSTKCAACHNKKSARYQRKPDTQHHSPGGQS